MSESFDRLAEPKYTPEEAAEAIHGFRSAATLRKLAQKGEIGHYGSKPIMFGHHHLVEFLERSERPVLLPEEKKPVEEAPVPKKISRKKQVTALYAS